jgi:hypothetical protein
MHRRLNDAATACDRITCGLQQLTDVSVLCPLGVQCQHPITAAGAAARAASSSVAGAASSLVAGAGGEQEGVHAEAPLGSDCVCRYIVNVASCAVGALATARAGRLKQLGPLCYPVGGALELLSWKGCSVQVGPDSSCRNI